MNGELIRLALFGIFANYSLPPTSTIFVTFESPNSTSSTDILPVSSFSLNLFNILALRCFVRVYRTKHEFFGKEFTTVILYSDASYRKQMESYEKRKAKMSETLADLQRRLGNNRGKERDAGSLEWEVSGIIYKDFRSVFGYKVGAVPGARKSQLWKCGPWKLWKRSVMQVLERLLFLLICTSGIPKRLRRHTIRNILLRMISNC